MMAANFILTAVIVVVTFAFPEAHTTPTAIDHSSVGTSVFDTTQCHLPVTAVNLAVSPRQASYMPSALVYVTCQNADSELIVTCLANGTWNKQFPTCQENAVKVSTDESNSEMNGCSKPAEPFPTGSFNLTATVVVYHCNAGYELIGSEVRYCLENHTWSDHVPECILSQKSSVFADQSSWLQVFVANVRWEGEYSFNGQAVKFVLLVLSTADNHVKAVLRDYSSQFELTGSMSNGSVSFHLTRQIERSRVLLPTTSWSVDGQLTTSDDGRWVYTGNIASSLDGFSVLTMSPKSDIPEQLPTDELMTLIFDDEEVPSSMALALGIAMAAVAIVIAGALAAFCVRRNFTLRSQGHQSLTSFENPVYDCEHVNLK